MFTTTIWLTCYSHLPFYSSHEKYSSFVYEIKDVLVDSKYIVAVSVVHSLVTAT